MTLTAPSSDTSPDHAAMPDSTPTATASATERPASATAPLVRTFTVGRAGQFRGDDGTGGRLAPSLHYAARMAAQLERVLDLGPLHRVTVDGPREITAVVEWSSNGELLLHASLTAGRTPAFVLPDDDGPRARHASEAIWVRARHGAESMARIDEVLRAVHAHTGVTWTVLLDENLTALRLFGTPNASTLAIVASRCHGVLRGLGLPDVHVLRLTYARGSLVLLPSGDVTTLLSTDRTDPTALDDVVVRAHAALADPAAATAAALDAALGPAVREPVYTPRARPAAPARATEPDAAAEIASEGAPEPSGTGRRGWTSRLMRR